MKNLKMMLEVKDFSKLSDFIYSLNVPFKDLEKALEVKKILDSANLVDIGMAAIEDATKNNQNGSGSLP